MKPTVSKILAFNLLLVPAASCRKSNYGGNTGTQPKSKTSLAKGSWKIQSFGLNDDNNAIINQGSGYTSITPAYRPDNTCTFNTKGKTVHGTTFSVTYGVSDGDGTSAAVRATSQALSYCSNFSAAVSNYTRTILQY